MNALGEVHSPPCLIKEIYDLLMPLLKDDVHIDVYEPGIGRGIFYELYPYKEKTTYTGCDIQYSHPPPFVKGDFFDQTLDTYDLILGNLPFNHGIVHTPCNKKSSKKSKTIWTSMLKKCIQHIKPNKYGAFIIPCIWLKPDRENIHELLLSKRILYLKTYDCVESNKLFDYRCQTPICYVIFQNTPCPQLKLWDKTSFVDFPPVSCIPTKNVSLMLSSLQYIQHHNLKTLAPIKIANMKKIIREESGAYFCIESITKTINGFYATTPGSYHGIPKIILANKCLPIPHADYEGVYGLYGRDKYIILGAQLEKVYDFLKEPIIQQIIKSFNIRMNFYEKHVFQYLPDPRQCDVEDYLYKLKS